jgi:hypothetical protein
MVMISTSVFYPAAPTPTRGVSASQFWGTIGILSPRFQVGIFISVPFASTAAVVAPDSSSGRIASSGSGFGSAAGSASAFGSACHIAVKSDAGAAGSIPTIGTTRNVVRRGGPIV